MCVCVCLFWVFGWRGILFFLGDVSSYFLGREKKEVICERVYLVFRFCIGKFKFYFVFFLIFVIDLV